MSCGNSRGHGGTPVVMGELPTYRAKWMTCPTLVLPTPIEPRLNDHIHMRKSPFPGGATIAEFRVEVRGTSIVVDHSIFRATDKGVLGMINVTGDERPLIFSANPRLITDQQAPQDGDGSTALHGVVAVPGGASPWLPSCPPGWRGVDRT